MPVSSTEHNQGQTELSQKQTNNKRKGNRWLESSPLTLCGEDSEGNPTKQTLEKQINAASF